MSHFFTWQHAIIKSQLEPTTRHVCLTIGCHMAADGSGCFPSYQTIADESGLSRRSVIEHVGKAAAAGYLTVDARQRENGSASSNIYRPTMPTGGERPALGGEPAALGGGELGSPPITDHLSNNPSNTPIGAPKPTKASSRANPRIGLVQFLENTETYTGREPGSWIVWVRVRWFEWAREEFGWETHRIEFEWSDFLDYWTSGNAVGGGLKSDWPATWRQHCRRVAGLRGRGPKPAGSGTGQGGFERHDHVAAARDSVLAELYGVGPKGHGRPPAAADTEPNPFRDEPEATEAVYVDVTASPETSVQRTAGIGGGGADRFDGSPLPLEVQSG